MPAKFNPQRHHRKSIRLKGYDYSKAGAYFVTVVTWQRDCLFGEVLNGEMRLNKAGKIVQWEWENLAQSFNFIELGIDQVMPNHFHGVLAFRDVGATRPGIINSPAGENPLSDVAPAGLDGSPLPRGPRPASLGAVIGQFKSRVTKRLWKIPELTGTPIWQRNYYERIIRNEPPPPPGRWGWRYIENNPATWAADDENPNPRKKLQTSGDPDRGFLV